MTTTFWQQFAETLKDDSNLTLSHELPVHGAKDIVLRGKCSRDHLIERSAYLILNNLRKNNNNFHCHLCSINQGDVKSTSAGKESAYKSGCDLIIPEDCIYKTDENGERWKQLTGDLSNYIISDNGFVFNLKTQKLLKTETMKGGYQRVVLSMGSRTNKTKQMIHRLVAKCFIPNDKSKSEDVLVEHIDKDSSNNHYTNLRWASFKDTGKKPSGIIRNKQALDPIQDEIWKTLHKDSQQFQLSNYGRIKTKQGYITTGTLKGHYRTYNDYSIHRLVAEAFLPIPDNSPNLVVNHIDGNGENNHVDNLEWITHSENSIHATNLDTHSHSRPIVQMNANGDVIAIHKSTSEAFKRTGVKEANIWHSLNGSSKSSGGYAWRYAMDSDFKQSTSDVLFPTNSRSVCQLDPITLEVIATFPSITVAYKEACVSRSSIEKSLASNTKVGKFRWKYENPNILKKIYQPIPVEQIDQDGNVMQKFKSIKEASRKCGICESTMRRLVTQKNRFRCV